MFGDAVKNKQKQKQEHEEKVSKQLNQVRIVNCAVVCTSDINKFNINLKILQDAGYTLYKDIIVFEYEDRYKYYQAFVKAEKQSIATKNPVSYVYDEKSEKRYVSTSDPKLFNDTCVQLEKEGFAPFNPNGINVRQNKNTQEVWFEIGFAKMKTINGLISNEGSLIIN